MINCCKLLVIAREIREEVELETYKLVLIACPRTELEVGVEGVAWLLALCWS
jgi:hypothetical protein